MKIRIGWRALARYLSGEASREEAAAVTAWASSDAAHAEVLDSARRAWNSAEPGPATFDSQLAWRNVARKTTERTRVRVVVWATGLLAASVALVVLTPTLLRNPTKRITTDASHVSTIHLDDGSVIRLAPNTKVRVASNGRREVWLDGKAFFAVAKKHGEPFVVHTPTGDAQVLGTRFELSSASRAVRLVVFEGRVALTATGSRQIVETGEVSSAERGGKPTAPQQANVSELSPWMKGVLIFQTTPLRAVADELARQYGVQVKFQNSTLENRTVSAVFEHQSLQTVVAAVCRVADATCEVQDNIVSISE